MDPSDEQNPYRSPESALDGAALGIPQFYSPVYRWEKRRLLFVMLLVYAIAGAMIGALSEDLTQLITAAASIATIILTLRWCEYDRRERGLEPWRYFGVMMILCPGPVVLLPIYFLSTRGMRGFLSIGKTLVFLVVLGVVMVLAELAGSALLYR